MGEMAGETNGLLLGHKAEEGERGGAWDVASGDGLPVAMTQEGGNIRAAIEWTLRRLPCSIWGPLPLWLPFQRGDRSFGKATSTFQDML